MEYTKYLVGALIVAGVGAGAYYAFAGDDVDVLDSGEVENKGKTAHWRIINEDGDAVGQIKWPGDSDWRESTRYDGSTDEEEVSSARGDLLGVLATEGYLPKRSRR